MEKIVGIGSFPSLTWHKVPVKKFVATSPLGEVTVALRRSAGGSFTWTATLPDKRVIASGTDDQSVRVDAEYHVDRLTKLEGKL